MIKKHNLSTEEENKRKSFRDFSDAVFMAKIDCKNGTMIKCPICGGVVTVTKDSYNGHRMGSCEKCKAFVIE